MKAPVCFCWASVASALVKNAAAIHSGCVVLHTEHKSAGVVSASNIVNPLGTS